MTFGSLRLPAAALGAAAFLSASLMSSAGAATVEEESGG